jgi:hypothetical protein
MKAARALIILTLVAGCTQHDSGDFVQGSIVITPPIHIDTTPGNFITDGGTLPGRITDAKGRTFDFYVDHRLGTKTPGAIYLNAYPGDSGSVRVRKEAEFKRKLPFP